MARKKKNNSKKLISTIITVIFLIIVAILSQNEQIKDLYIINNIKNQIISSVDESKDRLKTIVVGSGDIESEDNLRVFYIDVGQADSILIENKGETILIDAGNNEDGKNVVEFIKSKGVTELNYVIGTHPHEDHIGGLDDVINNIEIDNIFLPQIQTTTKTYQDVLEAIKNKDKKINSLKKGDKFKIGDAEFEVMTESILNKSNLNLSSNIIRMEFEGISFLFTGDAETENERTIKWIQTDILKVGHHGSTTSTSQKFLNQIKPQYAIISVGENNDYNHPNKKIMQRLENIGAEIFRTDESGTIEVIVTK